MNKKVNLNQNMNFYLTSNQLNFYEILPDFKTTNSLFITTYNIFTKENKLLENLKLLDNVKDFTIITNIPNRFDIYYGKQKIKAKKEIEKYLNLLNPSNFNSNVKIFFNFSNHSKIYLTDSKAYIGSGNFSDASKNNFESGIIINSESQVKKLKSNIFKELQASSIRYFGLEIEKHKEILSEYLAQISEIENKLLENICEYYDDGPGGRGYQIKIDTEIDPLIINNVYLTINNLNKYISEEIIDSSKISFKDFTDTFELIYNSLNFTLKKIQNFSFEDKALSHFEENYYHLPEIDDAMEKSISIAFEEQREIESEIIWSRKNLFSCLENLKLLLQPTIDLVEKYVCKQETINNT